MISTYPIEMIKRLEDRIKELELENQKLREDLSYARWSESNVRATYDSYGQLNGFTY